MVDPVALKPGAEAAFGPLAWFGGWPAIARIGVSFVLNMAGVASIAFLVSNYVAQTAMTGFASTAAALQGSIDATGAAVRSLDERLSQSLVRMEGNQTEIFRTFDRRADQIENSLAVQAQQIWYIRQQTGGPHTGQKQFMTDQPHFEEALPPEPAGSAPTEPR